MGWAGWRTVVVEPLVDGLRLAALFLALLPLCYGAAWGLQPGQAPEAPARARPAVAGFVASDGDFASYPSWAHFRLEGGGQAPRTVYYNRAPAPGSGAFPVGTILVKELESPGSPSGVEVDAMVKRGADFGAGPGGAPGWEWFGLVRNPGGRPVVLWRGTRSPGVGAYAGGGTSCAGCHALARDNDFVQSPPLNLAGLGTRDSGRSASAPGSVQPERRAVGP